MTDSDRTLKKNIAYEERELAKLTAKGQSWTADRFRERLDHLRKQLATPRAERDQYTKGTI